MAGTEKVETEIYAKLHKNREAHVEQARRARDYQAELANKGVGSAREDATGGAVIAVLLSLALVGLVSISTVAAETLRRIFL